MTVENNIYQGDRAREVLENEAYTAAFEAINQELTEQWKNSPIRDAEGREKLYLMQTMLKKVQMALENTMASGKLAKADLQHQQNMFDRAKAWTGLS